MLTLRNCLIMVCLLVYTLVNGQTIFNHEKEIENKEQFQFLNVDFYNATDDLKLSGTLVTPKTDYSKIVVIVPGSGKDTRNSHYKLTSEFLKHNIAVYRFDERGVGLSEGLYSNTISGLVSDISSAIRQLKRTYKDKQVGVLGHSLGGMATVVAHHLAKNKQEQVDFLVQLSTPVKSYSEASKYQITTLPHYQIKNKSKQQTFKLLDTLVGITQALKFKNVSDAYIREQGIKAIKNQGFNLQDVKFWSLSHIDLYKHDYEAVYQSLSIPTMYLIGTNDRYVDPTSETKRLQLMNNPKIEIQVMNNLNHYLTSGTLQVDALYNIHPSASDAIIQWMEKI